MDAAAAWLARRDRGFSSDEKSQFEAWRTADPEHSAAVARLDCSWSTMDRPLHSGVAGEVLRGLEIKARNRRRWRARATLVAALALMAAGSLWRAPQRTVAVSRPSAIVLMSARQILPDGTMVELRDSASIAVEFTMTQRRVTLSRGEAHFEVTKGDSRPFIVAAGGFEVRAVGTAFAVDHRLELIEVLVTEGLVAIAPRAPPADRPDIAATSTADTFVNAGENVAIAFESGKAIGPVSAVTVTEIAERLAWRSPRLEFTGTPLIEAIKFMNEHNRVQIVIDDASIAQVQVSGLFRADRADGFVEALETGFGIKAERRGHNDIVLRRAR
ncbi:MAG: FecR family protein [Opitutaceae bacterium]